MRVGLRRGRGRLALGRRLVDLGDRNRDGNVDVAVERRLQREGGQRGADIRLGAAGDRIAGDAGNRRDCDGRAALGGVSDGGRSRDIAEHDLRDRLRAVGSIVIGDADVGTEVDARVLVDDARSGDRRHVRDRVHGDGDCHGLVGTQQRDLAARQHALDRADAHGNVEVHVAVVGRLNLQAGRKEALELRRGRRGARRERERRAGVADGDAVRQRRRIDQRHARWHRDLGEVVLLRAIGIDARHRDRQVDRLVLVAGSRARDVRAVGNRCDRDRHRYGLGVRDTAQIRGRGRNRQRDILVGIRRRCQRQRGKCGTDLGFGAAGEIDSFYTGARERNGCSSADRRVGHHGSLGEPGYDDLSHCLGQRVVDDDGNIATKIDRRVLVGRLCGRRHIERISYRIDEHLDRRGGRLPVAVRVLRGDRYERHSIKQAAGIVRRQEIDVRHLTGRQRISARAVVGDHEGILVAQRIGQPRAGIDAADLDGMHFRAIEQIAVRGGEAVEMDGRVLVRDLVVAGRRDGISDSHHVDVVVEMDGRTIQIAGQSGVDIRLDGRDGDVERDSPVEVMGRGHAERTHERLDLGGRARHDERAVQLLRDRAGKRGIPIQRRSGGNARNDDAIDLLGAIRIIEADRDGRCDPDVLRRHGGARNRCGICYCGDRDGDGAGLLLASPRIGQSERDRGDAGKAVHGIECERSILREGNLADGRIDIYRPLRNREQGFARVEDPSGQAVVLDRPERHRMRRQRTERGRDGLHRLNHFDVGIIDRGARVFRIAEQPKMIDALTDPRGFTRELRVVAVCDLLAVAPAKVLVAEADQMPEAGTDARGGVHALGARLEVLEVVSAPPRRLVAEPTQWRPGCIGQRPD